MPKKATKNSVSQMLNTRSYKNLIYGAITVVVLFIVIYLGLRALSNRGGDISEEAQNDTVVENTYEVSEGDSLWSIAEKTYNDGYKWTEIAKENNINNPDEIEKGMKLTLPELKTKEVAMEEAPTTDNGDKITGEKYTVVEGDNLWTIAVRAYGDGYKWVDIAKANKLANPDLIYAGNEFTLPR